MSATASVTVCGKEVTVRELTVSEVRNWVMSIETGTRKIDPAGDALFADVTMADIALMSDAGSEWLETFGPSDLEPLADACKKMNPHFFRVRAVVQAAQVAHIRALLSGASETVSRETPAP